MKIDKSIIDIIHNPPEKDIKNILTKYHYLNRDSPSKSHSFGLYIEKKLCGVMVLAGPVGANVIKSLVEKEYHHSVLEIVRIFTLDNLPKNMNSYFVSQSLKQLRQIAPEKKIIISYADPSVGHMGKIYQALSFYYFGMTLKDTYYSIKGYDKHNRSIWRDHKTLQEIKDKWGEENIEKKELPQKHRYFYLNCKGSLERKKILKAIKIDYSFNYPEGDSKKAHDDILELDIQLKLDENTLKRKQQRVNTLAKTRAKLKKQRDLF